MRSTQETQRIAPGRRAQPQRRGTRSVASPLAWTLLAALAFAAVAAVAAQTPLQPFPASPEKDHLAAGSATKFESRRILRVIVKPRIPFSSRPVRASSRPIVDPIKPGNPNSVTRGSQLPSTGGAPTLIDNYKPPDLFLSGPKAAGTGIPGTNSRLPEHGQLPESLMNDDPRGRGLKPPFTLGGKDPDDGSILGSTSTPKSGTQGTDADPTTPSPPTPPNKSPRKKDKPEIDLEDLNLEDLDLKPDDADDETGGEAAMNDDPIVGNSTLPATVPTSEDSSSPPSSGPEQVPKEPSTGSNQGPAEEAEADGAQGQGFGRAAVTAAVHVVMAAAVLLAL